MTRRPVSVIVLAGGRSARFGRDKLAEPIDGRPLLAHAIDAVRPLAAEVLVVVSPGANPAVPEGIRLVHDRAPFEGPLAGLVSGLRAAREAIVLVVAGDVPEPVPAVLERLLAVLDDDAIDVAVLEQAGRPRPLPMALRRTAAAATAQRIFGAGERRLRSMLDTPRTTVLDEATWRVLDPLGRTMRDIDTPADLAGR
jgi:molybdopterin-guanine dinucleotide biosynthesis protein A